MAAHEFRARLTRDRVATAVVAIVLLGVIARLVGVGGRVAHYDEARVAWWTLNFMETGQFQYRYIMHGPFIQHVNTYVFALLGPSDFAMRLIPALAGGLLPLSALLFRGRLRGAEVVALALFLAVDPVLLYYSRFSRSTILVAGFMFGAFGLFVRAMDVNDVRYVYAGIAFVALGFTAKENAIVYLLCWLGAGALVLDARLFSPGSGESGFNRVRTFWHDEGARLRGQASTYLKRGVLAAALFTGIIVFFFAPRGVEVGFFRSLTNPAKLPAVLEAMLGLHPGQFGHLNWQGHYRNGIFGGFEYWFGVPANNEDLINTYITRLGRFMGVLAGYAAPLFGLSIAGFLVERYGASHPRSLVMFASYWGFASVLGYPLGADIWAAWIVVNALVPLAIPAAVGLGLVYRWGRDAFHDDDSVGVGLAALLVLLLAAQTGSAAIGSVYLSATGDDNELVQFAQPSQDLRPALDAMAAVSPDHDGTDVLVYDDPNATRSLVAKQEEMPRTPVCLNWHNALPLPWYTDKEDMDVACAGSPEQLDAELNRNPAFVIARINDRATVEEHLQEYEVYTTYHHRTTAFRKIVYVRSEYV